MKWLLWGIPSSAHSDYFFRKLRLTSIFTEQYSRKAQRKESRVKEWVQSSTGNLGPKPGRILKISGWDKILLTSIETLTNCMNHWYMGQTYRLPLKYLPYIYGEFTRQQWKRIQMKCTLLRCTGNDFSLRIGNRAGNFDAVTLGRV